MTLQSAYKRATSGEVRPDLGLVQTSVLRQMLRKLWHWDENKIRRYIRALHAAGKRGEGITPPGKFEK